MKILLVDDNVLVLRATSRLLTSRGHEVEACWQHDRAVGLAGMWADVALVDVDMPERTGPELVQLFPAGLPVVFYTGNPQGAPKGARVLGKPATADQIIDALVRAIG